MEVRSLFKEWKNPHSYESDGNIVMNGGVNWVEFFAINAPAMKSIEYLENYLLSDQEYISFFEKASRFKNAEIDFSAKSLALDLFRDYIESVENLIFSEEVAFIIAKTFSEAIRDGVTGFRKISILDGFSSDLDRIDCGDGYIIRRFKKGEFEKLHFKWDKDRNTLPIAEFCIEKIEESTFENYKIEVHKYDPRFQAIVTSLRLLAPGKVFSTVMHWERVSIGSIARDKGMMGIHSFHRQHAYKGSYNFESSHTDIIINLVDVLEPTDECRIRRKKNNIPFPTAIPKQLKLAIDRIISSTQRPSIEDSFIDHIVALEAVFGNNSDRFPGGLGYKLSIRAAKYIFNNVDDRKKCFKNISAALSIRGKIVHGGGNMDSLNDDEKSVVDEIGMLARRGVVCVSLNLLHKGLNFKPEIFDELLLT